MPSHNNTSKLQQWLENIWYNNGRGRFVLLPLSALYCAINTLQRKLQSKNPPSLPCPVIVVGNITVGGTGKTPLTIHIVQLLQRQGYKPAIITRGYGGKASTWPQSVTATSDAEQVGDEAVLMATRTNVPVYAGANRLQSIAALLKAHECDVIISDDGLQHYKLPRDISIAVIDAKRGLGNGTCLPAGPLREKVQRLTQCDFVITNGNPSSLKNDLLNSTILNSSSSNNEQKQLFSFQLVGEALFDLATNEEQPLSYFTDQTIHAITGIGNPERFYQTLAQGGLKLIKHSFPDHHDFKSTDLQFNDDLPIIMTEKDAVKCQSFAPSNSWFLPVSATFKNDFDQALLAQIDRINAD